jgi:hypothetical protein
VALPPAARASRSDPRRVVPAPGPAPLAEVLSGSNDGGRFRFGSSAFRGRSRQADSSGPTRSRCGSSRRRTSGCGGSDPPFVLATNPDVLLTPALFRAIGKGRLDRDSFYRTNRYDVTGVPLDANPRAQLAECRRSIVRVNLLGGSLRLDRPTGGVRLARAVRSYVSKQRSTQPRSRGPRCTTDRLDTHERLWGLLRRAPQLLGRASWLHRGRQRRASRLVHLRDGAERRNEAGDPRRPAELVATTLIAVDAVPGDSPRRIALAAAATGPLEPDVELAPAEYPGRSGTAPFSTCSPARPCRGSRSGTPG